MAKKQTIIDRPNVLVAGGAGFIGSRLCEELLRDKHVICVDNYLTGDEFNIDHLLRNPNFEFIKHDITQPLDFKNYPGLERFKLAYVGIQEIYHLACPGSPKYYLQYPLETLAACSLGTLNLLNLAAKYQSKFLFVSDSLVYGQVKGQGYVISENYQGLTDHMEELNYFLEGKRFAETLIQTFHQKYNLDTKIVRLFNTYGPGMKLDDGWLISHYIDLALQNKEITTFTDLISSSFCYVTDVVSGLIKMMSSQEAGPLNIGQPNPDNIEQIANQIIGLSRSKSQIKKLSVLESKDLWQLEWKNYASLPDISKAKELIGWFPIVLSHEGLKMTIDYLKSLRGVLNIRKNLL